MIMERDWQFFSFFVCEVGCKAREDVVMQNF